MAIMTPLLPKSNTTLSTRLSDLATPKARRQRRWLVVSVVIALCTLGAGIGLTVAGSGFGGGPGSRATPGAPDGSSLALRAGAGPAVDLAGGRWSTITPPRRGAVRNWHLAAWTGKYVIAWGIPSHCCGTVTAKPTMGSSEWGVALNPVGGSWRSIPPAPVDFMVESTTWTGNEVIVGGSTSGLTVRSAHNVLFGFDPTTWRWKRLAPPPIGTRSDAQVLWSGARLIVIGGQGHSATVSLNGATYNPATNRWGVLPAIPIVAVGSESKEEPVGVTPAWAAGTLYVWVTRQLSQSCGAGCREISAKVQALRWKPGSSSWQPGPMPPGRISIYDSTAVSMGTSIALVGGTSCLPDMSCPARMAGTSSLFQIRTGQWSPIAANAVLRNGASSFAWTGRRLIAITPYLTSTGYAVGGYAGAFDPAGGSWVNLPELLVPKAPPSGPILSGTLWASSRLISSGLMLTPGHRALTTGPITMPTCPTIKFPAWIGGAFCGPPPGPGSGSGPDGSCLGTEASPPCGPGMVAGRYYAYTLDSTCTNDYIDGRWWANELPGGSGLLDVWISVTAQNTRVGWIGPNGAVGFRPSTTKSCS